MAAPGSLDAALPVGVGRDEAGVDRKALAVDQAFLDTAVEDSLEHSAQKIAVSEAAVPVLGEGRMIGNRAIEPKPAEPAIGEVQMDLLAQTPL
jgi:hypothetical protein